MSATFNRVCNVLAHRLDLFGFRAQLALLKEQFSGHILAKMIQLSVDDVLLNSNAVVYRWLNAFECHRDEDKRAAIEALHAILPESACEFALFTLLQAKEGAVMTLSRMIDGIICAPTNQSALA